MTRLRSLPAAPAVAIAASTRGHRRGSRPRRDGAGVAAERPCSKRASKSAGTAPGGSVPTVLLARRQQASGRAPGRGRRPAATCRMPAALKSGTVTVVASTIAAMICGSLIARRAASACTPVVGAAEVERGEVDRERARAAARVGERELLAVDEVAARAARVGGQGVDRDRLADHLAAAGDALVLVLAAAREDEQRRAHGEAPHWPPSSSTVSSCGVGGRAAAEQHERLRAGVEELVRRARGDHHGVPGAHVGLLVAEPHAARAGDEVVDLLRDPVEVLDRLAAGRDRRLGQRLVDAVAARDARELADRRSVGGDERLAVFEADAFHAARVSAGRGATRRRVSDDGAAGHLVVQPARQAAGREGDAAPERGIGRALGAPREFRTAMRAAGALCGDGVTQDGVVQRMHLDGSCSGE